MRSADRVRPRIAGWFLSALRKQRAQLPRGLRHRQSPIVDHEIRPRPAHATDDVIVIGVLIWMEPDHLDRGCGNAGGKCQGSGNCRRDAEPLQARGDPCNGKATKHCKWREREYEMADP